MKILYSIQATGNGHISRAVQLMPYLKQLGDVDTMLSGSNATLNASFDVTYRSKGLSLFYKPCGGLDYTKIFMDNSLVRAYRDARDLPVEKYDLILNDFDFITALACKKKKVKSIQFGHQASFISNKTPRPLSKSFIGENVLKRYAKADAYVGLHFQSYDDHIFHPVIKDNIKNAQSKDDGHITVYLPSYDSECLRNHFLELKEYQFQWFTHDVDQEKKEANIHYFPIGNESFTQSLIHCHGIITGGGFETPAEALYLKKKLMSIPIRDHYEQLCNGAALTKLGATVLSDIDTEVWTQQILSWIENTSPSIDIRANDIAKTLDHILNLNDNMK